MPKYTFENIAINVTEKKKPTEEDKDNYLGLEHLDPGTLKVTRFGSEVAPIGEKLVMKKGDVLFGKRRAYQKKVAIAPFDGIFSAHGMVLRPNESVITKDFFPLFISSDYFLDKAIKISVGSLSPTINWRDLKILKFNIPDLDKQEELADILWSIIDTIECYREHLNQTEKLIKAYFKEQSKLWKTSGKGRVVKLGELTKIHTGKKDANASSENGRYPFFTCSRDILKIDEYSFDCECTLVAGNGELNAKYYNGKFDAYQRTYIIESNDPKILTVPYIYRFMQYYIDILKEEAIGGIIKYIKLNNLTEAEIIVPSISEQNGFIKKIELLEKSKNEMELTLEALTKLYKQITAKIFASINDKED